MHQVIDGKSVYVVDFDTMPELPITGLTIGEMAYKKMTGDLPGYRDVTMLGLTNPIMYAQVLNHALENGIITEPGKYGIHLEAGTQKYEIYKIIEK